MRPIFELYIFTSMRFFILILLFCSFSCSKRIHFDQDEGIPAQSETLSIDIKSDYPTLSGKKPLIIAHRGASGYLPEHTLAAYVKAILLGADYIEPDLVMTKDSILIVRHEPMLSQTTNVSELPEFASRKTKKEIDGYEIEDWFASDFTLEEIKSLRARQAMQERNQEYNDRYEIPTLEEVIRLVQEKTKQQGRTIGIYPETKHPSFHEKLGLPITNTLLETLTSFEWNARTAPVYIQSFEVSNLQYIRSKSNIKTIQLLSCCGVSKEGDLIFSLPDQGYLLCAQPYDLYLKNDSVDYSFLITDEGLDFIKTYADGIGPWKPFIIPYAIIDEDQNGKADDLNGDQKINNADKIALDPTHLIQRAHERGLEVHVYTFRNEPSRLLNTYGKDPQAEYRSFYKLGVDGVFTDFTDTARQARR